jgi:hypothetical protein
VTLPDGNSGAIVCRQFAGEGSGTCTHLRSSRVDSAIKNSRATATSKHRSQLRGGEARLHRAKDVLSDSSSPSSFAARWALDGGQSHVAQKVRGHLTHTATINRGRTKSDREEPEHFGQFITFLFLISGSCEHVPRTRKQNTNGKWPPICIRASSFGA